MLQLILHYRAFYFPTSADKLLAFLAISRTKKSNKREESRLRNSMNVKKKQIPFENEVLLNRKGARSRTILLSNIEFVITFICSSCFTLNLLLQNIANI